MLFWVIFLLPFSEHGRTMTCMYIHTYDYWLATCPVFARADIDHILCKTTTSNKSKTTNNASYH
jgi:hypothetical protein